MQHTIVEHMLEPNCRHLSAKHPFVEVNHFSEMHTMRDKRHYPAKRIISDQQRYKRGKFADVLFAVPIYGEDREKNQKQYIGRPKSLKEE